MDADALIAKRLSDAMEEAGRAATRKITAIIIKQAQANIPIGDPAVDPDPAFRLRDQFSVRSFGTYVSITITAPYAVKVHESRHLRHPRGGGMKFLEKAVISAIPLWQRLLEIEVEKKLREDFKEPLPDMQGAIAELFASGTQLKGSPAGPGGSLVRFGPEIE